MAKFAVTGVVKDHYATLVDVRTHRPSVADYGAMLGLPVVAGLVAWRRDVELQSIGELLAGVGVFTGGLFALLLQVFPLAQRLTDDPRLAGQVRLRTLVDQLEANASYAVLVGLAATGMLMYFAAITDANANLSSGASGLAVALLLHLVLTALMALKRIRAVYRQMRA